MTVATTPIRTEPDPLDLLRRYWQADRFRPLQREAVEAALHQRDSLVVMPTGSGKSLCYQLPALVCGGLTVVVSPLIALMKDQVDVLNRRGIPAAFLNSTQLPHEQDEIDRLAKQGKLRLLYVSPERAVTSPFLAMLSCCLVSSFVIDEAHCISHWGHDFRPQYTQLDRLRTMFPDAPIHAFTATATPRVRDEIVDALHFVDPVVLVGDFDRPNLRLSVQRRAHLEEQLVSLIREHPNQAGLVYCMRRGDTERISGFLQDCNIDSAAYHAGMSDDRRQAVQNIFIPGDLDVVVATVAFGMGIDRPDIRFVLHATMPSSMETYHQEIGRAGRDGQPAECVVFYGPDDYADWQGVLANQVDCLGGTVALLDTYDVERLMQIHDYCTTGICRHRQLTEHFGQKYELDNCRACDVCTDGNT